MERADIIRRENLDALLLKSANRDMRKLAGLRKELTAAAPGSIAHRRATVLVTDLEERLQNVRPLIEARSASRGK